MVLSRERAITLVIFLLIGFSPSVIGNVATQSSVNDWFPGLNRPPFSPPRWLIPITWTILYFMIGIAGFLLWERRKDSYVVPALAVYGVQLLLNALWPVLFFGMQEIGWAFVELCLLLASVAGFIVLTWSVSRASAYLFLPYAAWLTYAGYLNLMYWYLNP